MHLIRYKKKIVWLHSLLFNSVTSILLCLVAFFISVNDFFLLNDNIADLLKKSTCQISEFLLYRAILKQLLPSEDYPRGPDWNENRSVSKPCWKRANRFVWKTFRVNRWAFLANRWAFRANRWAFREKCVAFRVSRSAFCVSRL